MGLFDRVEARLERAVNGVFAKAFRAEVQPVEIASAIRRAMDDRASVVGKGRSLVPNIFQIELSGTDFDRLSQDEAALKDELVAAAMEHADSQHYQPGGPFDIAFDVDDTLETGVFRVRPATAKRPDATGQTGQSRAVPAPDSNAADPAAARGRRKRRTGRRRRRSGRGRSGSRRGGPGDGAAYPRAHGRPRSGAAGSTPPTGPGSTSTATATRSWAP